MKVKHITEKIVSAYVQQLKKEEKSEANHIPLHFVLICKKRVVAHDVTPIVIMIFVICIYTFKKLIQVLMRHPLTAVIADDKVLSAVKTGKYFGGRDIRFKEHITDNENSVIISDALIPRGNHIFVHFVNV